MQVVVVGNRDDDDDGFVGEYLVDRGATLKRRHREDPSSLVGVESGADLLVLLGSDWSVYDSAHADEVAGECDLIIRARAQQIPILGICFGGQMLSAALGHEVRPTEVPEIGWREVTSRDRELVPNGPWFQYHFDRWVDARGDAFAENRSGPQAAWYGSSLALQFHPEVNLVTAIRWCEEGSGQVAMIGEDLEAILEETRRQMPEAKQRCDLLMDRFFAQLSHRRNDL